MPILCQSGLLHGPLDRWCGCMFRRLIGLISSPLRGRWLCCSSFLFRKLLRGYSNQLGVYPNALSLPYCTTAAACHTDYACLCYPNTWPLCVGKSLKMSTRTGTRFTVADSPFLVLQMNAVALPKSMSSSFKPIASPTRLPVVCKKRSERTSL